MGEDLDGLSLRELQHVEQQLDSGLKHIRSRKVSELKGLRASSLEYFYKVYVETHSFNLLQNQLMHESIAELQRKVSSSLIYYSTGDAYLHN